MNDTAAGRIDWNDPSLAKIRRDMLRFAQLQLRDAGAAEDMVQEALFSAMLVMALLSGARVVVQPAGSTRLASSTLCSARSRSQ